MLGDMTCYKCAGKGTYMELLSTPQEIYILAENMPNSAPHIVKRECTEWRKRENDN